VVTGPDRAYDPSVEDQPLTDTDTHELLRSTERARLRALVDGDMATAAQLHADDYQLIPPGGGPLSKAEYLGAIADGTLRYHRFEPDGDLRVRVWGAAAAIRYEVVIEVVAEGTTYHDRCWHTDIYELRAGRWVAVWSQATRIRSL
jgi:hypothetical protein